MAETPLKHYLLASDFDQTLSFKDSGLVLSELLGISRTTLRAKLRVLGMTLEKQIQSEADHAG